MLRSRKEEIMKKIKKANILIKEMPVLNIETLKIFSEKELKNLLDEFELILDLQCDIANKCIKILSDEIIENEIIIVKKINLDDLFI